MARLFKILAYFLAAMAGILIIAAIAFSLLFDPNDYRDTIAAEFKESTGRDLTIEGDLEVTLFPWLAIDVGRTTLSNGDGFGDEPFASFEAARLSVRMMPMLLRREIKVGTAALDQLTLNLAINKSGRSNWQDFLDASDAAPEDAESGGPSATLDINSIDVNQSQINYTDAQTGDVYRLTELNMKSGRVTPGDPVPLDGSFRFAVQPDDLSGQLELDTVVLFDADAGTISFDGLSAEGLLEGLSEVPTTLKFETPSLVANTKDETVTLGKVDLSLLGIDILAEVEPFSYADEILPVAMIDVPAFSLRSLMQQLDIEVPETADPNALGKAIIDAKLTVQKSAYALTNVNMKLDESTFKGSLSIPRTDRGLYRFDFTGDSIDLDRYMEPVPEAGSAASTDNAPVEIPSDLIRLINARGNLTLTSTQLTGLKFTDVKLGVDNRNGKLRLNPFTANLFGGTYSGDVQVDASGSTPTLSVDENISGVKLAELAAAMFDKQNISGTINGRFAMTGSGNDVTAMQKSLNGGMAFEIVDGAYEGTDLWYELRRARAQFKQEPLPQPTLPARTRFSEVKATGPVVNGVFQNNELSAELPFMQVKGKGTVDLAAATVDYRLTARVLEKPEFVNAEATEAELKEFTEAVIPLRVTGPVASPSIKPDIEKMLKDRVKEKLEEKLEDKLKDLFKR